MKPVGKNPDPFKDGPSRQSVIVRGMEFVWNEGGGTVDILGLPAIMLWVDSTLVGLMSGLATMVGPERFSLALQSEGRKSVESDWQFMSAYPDFRAGFAAVAAVAAVAGWGDWQLVSEDQERRECRFRGFNTWEGLYQRRLDACWGSAMLAGKLAGYCSKRFGTNCWAVQTSFIARGDDCDEFIVAPSSNNVEEEIARLLDTDQATRADMAVALSSLREMQARLIEHQDALESQVRKRTLELAGSLRELQSVNNRLQLEVEAHTGAEHALAEREVHIRRIIEHAPIGMAIVSEDGRLELINQKGLETVGYSRDELPDLATWYVRAYPDEECRRDAMERWRRHVADALARGREIQRDDYFITCGDGVVRRISIFGVIISGRVLVMFDDVTLNALREDLLRQANTELENRVRERTSELADRNLQLEHTMAQLRRLGNRLTRAEEHERKRMAHVLHDQLQQLLVAASFRLTALGRSLVDPAHRASVHAAGSAIEEALAESRSLVQELSPPILREGGLAPAMRWIRQRMFDQNGLSVRVEVAEEACIIGEDLRTAIFHAVRELLLNVVKHSGVSSAGVTITFQPDGQIRVVVEDSGRGGTPPGPAYQSGSEMGFGLLTVRERFENLGGRMQVDSAPGEGFRVTLTAPVDCSVGSAPAAPGGERAPAAGAVEPDAPAAGKGRIRVLLADDHRMLRQGLVELISRDSGLEVVGEAADGEDTLRLVPALNPDVVLMDVNMPGMGGVEATRLLHARYPGLMIIGLSMYAETHPEEEMRAAGAVAYVAKSEAAEVLLATIHACCGR